MAKPIDRHFSTGFECGQTTNAVCIVRKRKRTLFVLVHKLVVIHRDHVRIRTPPEGRHDSLIDVVVAERVSAREKNGIVLLKERTKPVDETDIRLLLRGIVFEVRRINENGVFGG